MYFYFIKNEYGSMKVHLYFFIHILLDVRNTKLYVSTRPSKYVTGNIMVTTSRNIMIKYYSTCIIDHEIVACRGNMKLNKS